MAYDMISKLLNFKIFFGTMFPDPPNLHPKVYLADLSLHYPSWFLHSFAGYFITYALLTDTMLFLRGLYLMIQIHTLPDLDLFSGKLIIKSVNGSAASLYM